MQRIGLQANPTSLTLAPGETAPIQVVATNVGSVVDLFSFSVEGLPESWYTLPGEDFGLFPQDSQTFVITVHPPGGEAGGSRAFRIVGKSRDDPAAEAAVTVTVELAATGASMLDMQPKRVQARKGLYSIELNNPGNSTLPVSLALSDPEEGLFYTLGAATERSIAEAVSTQPPPAGAFARPLAKGAGCVEYDLELSAFTALRLPLLARPRKRSYFGRQRYYTFTVGVHPPGVQWEPSEAQAVQGELIYKPPFAAWSNLPRVLQRAIMAAIPVLAVILLLIALLRTPAQPSTGIDTPGIGAPTASANIGAPGSGSEGSTSGAGGVGASGGSTNGRGTPSGLGSGANGGSGSGSSSGSGPTPGTSTGAGDSVASALDASQENRFLLVMPTPGADPLGAASPFGPHLEWVVTPGGRGVVTQTSRLPDGADPGTAMRVDYHLSVSGTRGLITNTAGLLLIYPPALQLLGSTVVTVTAGVTVPLQWQVTGGKTVSLEGTPVPGAGTGSGGAGVQPLGTHTYIVCATNSAGTVCDTKLVVVVGPPPATYTPQPAASNTATATATPTARPAAATSTSISLSISAPTSTPTRTPVPPAATPTLKPPPTKTAVVAVPSTATPARPSATVAHAPSSTSLPTHPPTYTPAPTFTALPTRTHTAEPSATSSATSTSMPTSTNTDTPTRTLTATPLATYTPTPTRTNTAPPTRTNTNTNTVSPTRTNTTSPTRTRTPTYTASVTSTPTQAAQCDTYISTDVPKQLPADDSVRSTLAIRKSGVISSVQVLNLDLTLNLNGAQQVTPHLLSPGNNVIVALFSWTCAGRAHLRVTLDDFARGTIPYCQGDVTGTYKPDINPLSDLKGTNSQGIWTMLVDVSAYTPLRYGNVGQAPPTPTPLPSAGRLNGWGLQVCYAQPSPTSVPGAPAP